ncbi:MAG: hypothetical protein RJB13_228 [Pseudomonadota bacterium]
MIKVVFRYLRLTSFIPCLLILIGCKESSKSDPSFAVVSQEATLLSLFRESVSTKVPISVCYVARDSTNDEVNQRNYQQLKGHLETAFRKWMAPLKSGLSENGKALPSPPAYSLQQELKLGCAGSETIKVYFYVNNSDFQNTCNLKWGPHQMIEGGCRSFAVPKLREIWLNLSAEENQREVGALVLHELGHLFGLLDTYREKGSDTDSERAFQPVATAMSRPGFTELAKDDQEGIRAVWKMLVLGLRAPRCGAGYKLHTVDKYGGVYCIFDKTDTSEEKKVIDMSGAAIKFNCTEHFAMMGSWAGCLEFLDVRAQIRGSSVNASLDPSDILAAVDACVTANPGQTTTCTKKMLSCLTWQWADDNYACFAVRGGFACFSKCKNP